LKHRITIIVGVLGLVIGITPGFYLGRALLEAKWRDGVRAVSADEATSSSIEGADPTPKAGTKIVRDMPIGRARVALGELTNADPVKVTLGTFGRNDDSTELHLNLKNGATCEVTSVEGVAYGFDAWGRPTPVNKAGETYVAFTVKDLKIAPGGKGYAAQEAHFAKLANMALAHVDKYTCSDGSSWTRK
jgi:hypothetical protein